MECLVLVGVYSIVLLAAWKFEEWIERREASRNHKVGSGGLGSSPERKRQRAMAMPTERAFDTMREKG